MSPHQILIACSRLGAIVWGIFAIRQIPESWLHVGSADSRTPVLVLTAVQFALCLFLWFFPATVARKILPPGAAALPTRPTDWRVLGIILIGLWTFTQVVPRVAYWVIFIRTLASADIAIASLTAVQKGQIASTSAELAVAIFLVFGARATAAYLFGIRSGSES